jgi:hypothetical protein
MKKPYILLFWLSGLCIGLMVCAYFACPHWQIACPTMLVLSGFVGRVGYTKMKA